VVEHIDTTDPRPLTTMARWDVANVVLGLRNAWQLVKRLRGKRGVVYVPASAFMGAFLRDSLFIHAAALARWKVAFHIANSLYREFYEARGPLARWWIRLTLRRVDGVAVLGPRLHHTLDGLVPRDRVAVVPNGTPEYEPADVPRHSDRVLYFGNFHREKGVVEAVDAALIIVEARPRAEVVFTGAWNDPSLERELRARTATAGDRIRFDPPVTGRERERVLQSSTLLLFPARENEGHPRAILEAICRGLPIVTTAQANFNAGLTDGKDAFVLDRPDPDRLAARVLELLDDNELRERMGTAARALYEAEFTQVRADQRLADWLSTLAV